MSYDAMLADSYGSAFGAAAGVSAVYLIFCLALSIFQIFCWWKIYEKIDLPGWVYLIPFYGVFKLYDALYGNGWKFLLLLVPLLNIYIVIKQCIDLSHELGRSTAFGVGMLLIPYVFNAIAAFSDGPDYYENNYDNYDDDDYDDRNDR